MNVQKENSYQQKFVASIDCYSQTLEGDIASTLRNSRADSDHVPCCVIAIEDDPTPKVEVGVAYSLRSRDFKEPQCVLVINGQGGADYNVTKDVTDSLTAATNSSGNNKLCVAVLNDMGGNQMYISKDVTGTLRSSTHVHK